MNDVSGNNQDAQEEWSPDELIPFGKYILLDRINSGATAAVYRANVRGEAGFERLVAIKRILPHMAGDRDFVDTFVREAKTVARLTHASICPIYELGKVGESLYMAIEYIQGRDLGHLTRRLSKRGETMPPVVAAWIATRLCESLDYAHSLKNASGERVGILHRDLSPSNILVSYEGQVKLIDFGLAKAVGRAQSTNVDALKRKLGYMSPEMVKGRPLDARSDIFGVGVCLYEMITSRRLFSGASDIDTLKLVGKALVPPPSAIVDDAPEELEIIVMHALEREPEDRFQSAVDMGDALNAYLHKADPTFNSLRLSAWMHELFGDDIDKEQQRIKRLLAASADPELIKQRRLFFASPSGAAARARAEVERRMSTEPPPVSGAHAPVMPKTARVPREMQPPSAPTARTTQPLPVLRPKPPQPAGKPAPFEDEPTDFYDAERTKASHAIGQAQRPAAFEDEPTGFYDGDKTRSADLDKTRAADTQKTRAVDADKTRPAAQPLPPTDSPFEDEPTQYLLGGELEEIQSLPAPVANPASVSLPVVKVVNPFDFEDEATEIFFNKEEGLGIPEILEEVERPTGGLNKPILSPDLAYPVPAPARITPTPPHALPRFPAQVAPPQPAAWSGAQPMPAPAAIGRPRTQRTTLDVALPRRSPTWPMVAVVGLVLAVLAVLVVLTPLGVAIGVRPAPTGAIEVRTTPAVPADVQLDQVYRGRAPLRLDGVRAGSRRIDIAASGYLPVTHVVDVQPNATAAVEITLVPDRPRIVPLPGSPEAPTDPQGAAPTPVSPVPGVIAEPASRPAEGGERNDGSERRRARRAERELAAVSAGVDAPAPSGNGTLVVNSVPWALVYVDGKDTGRSTPLMGYPLTPGSHEVRLQTATGQVHVQRVEARAGETVRVSRRF